MELTRRDLTQILGGMLGISLAGCTTNQPTQTQQPTTMDIQHETQTFDTDFSDMELSESQIHRFVDEEYGNVLYLLGTRDGWVVNIADINEEKQTQS